MNPKDFGVNFEGEGFAVISGDYVVVVKTIEEAKEAASLFGGNVSFETPDEFVDVRSEHAPMRMVANAPDITPEGALRAAHLEKQDFMDIITHMSMEEAHSLLLPYFPKNMAVEKTGEIKPFKAQLEPNGMAEGFLSDNYKMAKGAASKKALAKLEAGTRYGRKHGMQGAHVIGLSLLAHRLMFERGTIAGDRVGDALAEMTEPKWGAPIAEKLRGDLCIGSSVECRAGCLVHSGHGNIGKYNTIRRFALTQALIKQPAAFVRMLAWRIEQHARLSYDNDKMPLVRLNVFSDIPWELFVPDMYPYFGRDQKRRHVQFYDYTKVPDRVTPENYDLTFSYSGDEKNVERMQRELARGRRVAMVFAVTYDERGQELDSPKQAWVLGPKPKGKTGRCPVLPRGQFLGRDVIDGDETDLRPYNPPGCIVGLTWKVPLKQYIKLEDVSTFIVRGVMIDGSFVICQIPQRLMGMESEAGRIQATAALPHVVKQYELEHVKWPTPARGRLRVVKD